jgi:hypothetical protein
MTAATVRRLCPMNICVKLVRLIVSTMHDFHNGNSMMSRRLSWDNRGG